MTTLPLSKILDQEIQAGLVGLNEGLPMGLPRLGEEVCNIQRRRYDLIGGDIGSGKTAYLDTAYVLNPYDFLKKNPHNKLKLSILYFSLELGRISKITKLMSWKIFKETNIVVPTRVIASKGQKNRLPEHIYKIIKAQYAYFDELENTVLDFRDGSLKPDSFYAQVKGYAEKHGKFINRDPNDVTSRTSYKPNDPNVIHLIIVDHLGLVASYPKKTAIETISQYAVWFRNICGFSPVFVQQYNRSLQSADRTRLNMLEPRMADFKETSSSQEDAETIIALFSPSRYKLPDYYGFDMKQIKNRVRGAYILKNRDGKEDVAIMLNFFGEIGMYREFPTYTPGIVPKEFYEVGTDITKDFNSQINYTQNGGNYSNPGGVRYGKDAFQ